MVEYEAALEKAKVQDNLQTYDKKKGKMDACEHVSYYGGAKAPIVAGIESVNGKSEKNVILAAQDIRAVSGTIQENLNLVIALSEQANITAGHAEEQVQGVVGQIESLQNEIEQVAGDLTSEVTRATTAEAGIQSALDSEIETRTEDDATQNDAIKNLTQRIEAEEGRGGMLNAYDFGVADPTPTALNAYALSQIPSISDPSQIFNGTSVINLYNNIFWTLTNTPDTEPPVFDWAQGSSSYRPCYNSAYIKVHAPKFIDFLLDNYDLDGIWQNALGFDYGPCYCKNCRELYLKDTGKEIPPLPNDPYDYAALNTPQFAEYNAWKAVQADKHIEMMRAGVKKHGAEKAYCAEIFDIYSQGFTVNTGISQINAKKSFDFIISAVFLGKHYLWDNRLWDTINNSATTIRFARALDPKKQPVICTGCNGTTWRYVKDPLVDNRQWMWEIASVGGGIWNCYFNGRHPGRTSDRRAAYSEKDVYTYLADNSDIISDTVPCAEIGVYYSNATRDHLLNGDESKDQYGVCFRGIERVLLENHIQYQFIPGTELSSERLALYKTVLLPNTAYLSDKEITLFKEYVKNGGSIIASFKTGLFDEKGNARSDFGMADLLGVSYTGLCVDTSVDTFQLIREKDHPLMKDIGDTDMIINGGQSLIVTKENKDYDTVVTYIPTIHSQPPEYAWIPDMKTDYPTVIAGKYGMGRVAYFANPIEALIHTNGHDDYRGVYKNALDYISGGNYLVKTDAPGSVHINVIKDQNDPNHLILSMVNATGTYQRPWKKLISVPVELTVAVDGKPLRFSKALWGDGIKAESKKDGAFISIPLLHEFANIELKF